MKKLFLLCLSLVAALGAVAEITVCDMAPDANGHFDCPFIKSGSITWDEVAKTLTLNNAVVEYSSETPYDYVYPIRITEDYATIIIQGECKLTSTGFIAISIEGTNSKNVTIQGDGSLYLSCIQRGIYLKCARLTLKDIALQTTKGIMNNGNGVLCALTFDNVRADINGLVEHIGEAISFQNCAITYPEDAYIDHNEYGYYIAQGNGSVANHIVISRTSNLHGDVNNDGEVNIIDVDEIIKVILGSGSSTAADVNKDGEINILDVDGVINVILGVGSPQDNHEYVDLGLPSGTLWATCNIGANSPEEYGDYFAWGETAPKEVYNWETYKWCRSNGLTKYCTRSSEGYNGFVDNKYELDPEDDAAYVNWGPLWRMPTLEQIKELIDNCTWQWTTRDGKDGQLVTGPNGNTLFLPANENDAYYGSYGRYWSRELYRSYPKVASALQIYSSRWYWGDLDRPEGHAVRAVRVSQN